MANNNNYKKKNNKKSNSKGKYNNNNKFDSDDEFMTRSKTKGSNDPSWYGDPVLIKNAADIPFPYATGSRFVPGNTTDDTYINVTSMPGILSLRIMPTFGTDPSGVAGINMASNNFYSFVRHMNSGSSQYDAADLMIYILAMDSIYSFHAWVTRLYGTLLNYSAENWYYPENLIQVQGVDYDDLLQHIPDLRLFINSYAKKANTLHVPNKVDMYRRHSWMYSNYYNDDDIAQGQTVVMFPDGFYQYHESIGEDEKLLGTLTYHQIPNVSKPWKFSDIVNFGNKLVEVNRNSEDHNVMSGDIQKAYGSELFELGQIADNYTVTPIHDEEVLMQIHNSTIVGNSYVVTNEGVDQVKSTGQLFNHVYMKNIDSDNFINRMWLADRILDVKNVDPSADEVMVATRLMFNVGKYVENKGYPIYAGSDIVVSATVWYNFYDYKNHTLPTKLTGVSIDYNWNAKTVPIGEDYIRTALTKCELSSRFAWAPHQYISYDVPGTGNYYEFLVSNLKNATIIKQDTLKNMNEIAVLGLLGIK